jgi:C_GCAxxG_C_C family probable redox protein
MNRSGRAIELFAKGWNCNQSVLASWSPDFGVTEELSFKIGLGYGGGMGRMGKTCGAVTGAYTAIGLWVAGQSDDIPTQKKIAAEKVQEFNRLFIEKYGKLECRELLGYDFSIPQEADLIHVKKLTATLCPEFVGGASDLLDKVLK